MTEDNTELRRAEQEIQRLQAVIAQRAEDTYRTLFDSIDEGFCVIELLPDAQGTAVDYQFLEVNQVFEQQTGLAGVLGRRGSELTPGTERHWVEAYGRVAQTGEPVRFENYHEGTQRWYSAYAARVGGAGSGQVAIVFADITGRKQAELVLQQHEARQSFLLQLSDALGPLSDAVAIQEAVTRVALDHFGADRCYYGEILDGQCLIRRDAARGGAPSLAGTYDLAALPLFSTVLAAGRPIVVEDVRTTDLVDDALRQVCVQLEVISFLNVPVAKDGVPQGILCVVQRTPRAWAAPEVALVAEVAERTWAAVARARAEEALRASEAAFRTVCEAAPAFVWVCSPTGENVYFNTYWYDFTGQTLAEASGYGWTTTMHPDDAARILPYWQRCQQTGEIYAGEVRYRRHDGMYRWYVFRALPRRRAAGAIAAWYGVSIDIDDVKRAEAALRASEAQLASFNQHLEQQVAARTQELVEYVGLLEQSEEVAQLGSWVAELATGALRWSAGMYRLFGRVPGTPVGPAVYFDYVVADDRPVAERVVRALTNAPAAIAETLRIQVGEAVKVLRLKTVVLYDAQGVPAQVLGIDLDETETQRLGADNLRLRLSQQHALFEAVQAAQEAERKRMAESLHNGIGQTLYATKLQLNQLQALPLDEASALRAARQQAEQLLGDAIRQTRALSHELVPLVLEDFGLAAALQSISQKMSTPQLRLHSHVLLDEAAAPLAPPLQLALYRMAQELAQNVVKHAHGATAASLELETMPGWVLLRAEDNGPGFGPAPTAPPGLGLRSIRDRVALLGGQVDTGSERTGGAYVRIRIPLPTTSRPAAHDTPLPRG